MEFEAKDIASLTAEEEYLDVSATSNNSHLVEGKDISPATSDEINELLSSKDYARAYTRLTELADQDIHNANLNVVTGLMALSIGNKDDAFKYFERAIKADPHNSDAIHNCAVLAMSNGDIETALNCFERLIKLLPADASVYNDLAVIWMEKGNVEKVKECFSKSLQLNPNFNQVRKNAVEYALTNDLALWASELLEFNGRQAGLSSLTISDIQLWKKVIAAEQKNTIRVTTVAPAAPNAFQLSPDNDRIRNKKIAVLASHKSFVVDIIEKLKNDKNEIREFNLGSTHDLLELMDWADLAWFEWCDNLLIEATKYPKKCPIVCRLHSYEAFTDMPTKVDWSKVDQLVFVNRSVEELVRPLITGAVPWTVIHNGVDCQKFQIPSGKQFGKKIASVGYINYKKNPTLLLYCFKKIYEYDPEYTFHVAGAHQDARIKLYFDNFLKENPLPLTFYGWVNDMAQWYADKNYVISTSLFESFHYSIAEGMASGLLPLIHNWYGAQYLYPSEYMFNDPDNCLKLLQEIENLNIQEEQIKNRQFVINRYDVNEKFGQISKLLKKVVTK